MGPRAKFQLNPTFPGWFSSEFGELDSHGLEKAVLDAHNLKFDVSSTICMHTSHWAHATAVVLVPVRKQARGLVGMSQHNPAKPHSARWTSVGQRLSTH